MKYLVEIIQEQNRLLAMAADENDKLNKEIRRLHIEGCDSHKDRERSYLVWENMRKEHPSDDRIARFARLTHAEYVKWRPKKQEKAT